MLRIHCLIALSLSLPVLGSGLLENPLEVFGDANTMFLFAAKDQASGKLLAPILPKIDHLFAKGIIGYGSQNSSKIAAGVGVPIDKFSSIYASSKFASTDGHFAFLNPDLNYRKNNDQRRYEALINFEHNAPTSSAHVLAIFNNHEGGIPGFAFSPTLNLRQKAYFIGLSTGFSKKINKAELKLKLMNSLFNYESFDVPSEHEKYLTSTHELNFSIDNLGLPDWFNMELGEILVVERSYDKKHTRVGGGLFIKRLMRFKSFLKPRFDVYFNMIGYKDHGLLFKKDFKFSIEPLQNINVSTGFTRSSRLPTFMELYANNSFFANNEGLKKESLWDFYVSSNMHFGDHTNLQIKGFWGYLSDIIVYEPYNINKIRPKNIETATRMGLDVDAHFEPNKYFMIETKNSLLRTKVKATNSPLPNSPPFLGLTRLRVGPADMLSLSLQSRYRCASNADDEGNKKINGYVLFDALLSGHFAEIFTLSLSVTNILNTKYARDSYETPLPGTVFFGQLEVGN